MAREREREIGRGEIRREYHERLVEQTLGSFSEEKHFSVSTVSNIDSAVNKSEHIDINNDGLTDPNV